MQQKRFFCYIFISDRNIVKKENNHIYHSINYVINSSLISKFKTVRNPEKCLKYSTTG